jgi:hypothetical protein
MFMIDYGLRTKDAAKPPDAAQRHRSWMGAGDGESGWGRVIG